MCFLCLVSLNSLRFSFIKGCLVGDVRTLEEEVSRSQAKTHDVVDWILPEFKTLLPGVALSVGITVGCRILDTHFGTNLLQMAREHSNYVVASSLIAGHIAQRTLSQRIRNYRAQKKLAPAREQLAEAEARLRFNTEYQITPAMWREANALMDPVYRTIDTVFNRGAHKDYRTRCELSNGDLPKIPGIPEVRRELVIPNAYDAEGPKTRILFYDGFLEVRCADGELGSQTIYTKPAFLALLDPDNSKYSKSIDNLRKERQDIYFAIEALLPEGGLE